MDFFDIFFHPIAVGTITFAVTSSIGYFCNISLARKNADLEAQLDYFKKNTDTEIFQLKNTIDTLKSDIVILDEKLTKEKLKAKKAEEKAKKCKEKEKKALAVLEELADDSVKADKAAEKAVNPIREYYEEAAISPDKKLNGEWKIIDDSDKKPKKPKCKNQKTKNTQIIKGK